MLMPNRIDRKKLYLIIVTLTGLVAWNVISSHQQQIEITANLIVPPQTKAVSTEIRLQEPVQPLQQQPPEDDAVKNMQEANTPIIHKLKLELLGTMMAGKKSAAIIRLSPSKEQTMAFIGDMLRDDVQLKAIEQDAITIDHSGRLERISLTWGQNQSHTDLTSAPPVQKPKRKQKSKQQAAKLASIKRIINETIAPGPTDGYNELSPYINSKGKTRGYYAEDFLPAKLLNSMGLQNGDVIRNMNNVAIRKPKNIWQGIMSIRNEKNIDIKIIRAGKTMRLRFGDR